MEKLWVGLMKMNGWDNLRHSHSFWQLNATNQGFGAGEGIKYNKTIQEITLEISFKRKHHQTWHRINMINFYSVRLLLGKTVPKLHKQKVHNVGFFKLHWVWFFATFDAAFYFKSLYRTFCPAKHSTVEDMD